MAQDRPPDQKKELCITTRATLKHHPNPQQHETKALIALPRARFSQWGAVFVGARFSQRNQPKKALSTHAAKHKGPKCRVDAFQPHKNVVLDLKD